VVLYALYVHCTRAIIICNKLIVTYLLTYMVTEWDSSEELYDGQTPDSAPHINKPQLH